MVRISPWNSVTTLKPKTQIMLYIFLQHLPLFCTCSVSFIPSNCSCYCTLTCFVLTLKYPQHRPLLPPLTPSSLPACHPAEDCDSEGALNGKDIGEEARLMSFYWSLQHHISAQSVCKSIPSRRTGVVKVLITEWQCRESAYNYHATDGFFTRCDSWPDRFDRGLCESESIKIIMHAFCVTFRGRTKRSRLALLQKLQTVFEVL